MPGYMSALTSPPARLTLDGRVSVSDMRGIQGVSERSLPMAYARDLR